MLQLICRYCLRMPARAFLHAATQSAYDAADDAAFRCRAAAAYCCTLLLPLPPLLLRFMIYICCCRYFHAMFDYAAADISPPMPLLPSYAVISLIFAAAS